MFDKINGSPAKTRSTSFNDLQGTDKPLSEQASDALDFGARINAHIQSKNYLSGTAEGTFSKKDLQPIQENITNNRELTAQAASTRPSVQHSRFFEGESHKRISNEVPVPFLKKTIAKDHSSSEKQYYGNCGEKALDALNYIAKNFPAYQNKVELVTITNKETKKDHAFLILNRAQHEQLALDPKAWGDDVIICDPHAQITCLAQDYKEHNFKVFASDDNDWRNQQYTNTYELFQPSADRFEIDVRHNSSDMMKLVEFHRSTEHKSELKGLLKSAINKHDEQFPKVRKQESSLLPETEQSGDDDGMPSFLSGRLEALESHQNDDDDDGLSYINSRLTTPSPEN